MSKSHISEQVKNGIIDDTHEHFNYLQITEKQIDKLNE